MELHSETTQTVSALKLPILKTREYYLWSMRMEQYLTFTDHALWEVIVNGDSVIPIASASAGAEAIPDEHLLKFHACKDAKSLWEAIKNRFGDNKESKKIKKTILKQNYENFAASNYSSSTNETVNTAHSVSTVSSKDQASTPSYADDVMIDADDLEEMDLKWQVAMLTMRIKRFIKKTGRKMDLNDKETVGFDRTKAEERHHKLCSKWPNTSQYNQQREALNKSNLEIIGYQMGLESLEARIVVHEKNEAVYKKIIAFFKINVTSERHSIKDLKNQKSDVDDSLVNDRFKTGKGFHAVPSPYTKNYMPSRPDLSFAGPKSNQTKPKYTKINFVKSGENVKSVNKENTHRQVEYPRKSQSPRGKRRNWNGMMTQKLGNGFEFIKKACFVYGSFNHLIKDCDFHENKMIEKLVLNNKGMVTGQREIRQVWNNAQRVNHLNKLTHPQPKRNFVPTAVATKPGQVPVNTAKQSSPRAATSISTVRPVNIDAPKPKVNDALPTTPKTVVSAAVGNVENVIKSSACWIWRPTGNVIDHNSKDNGSYMLKRFDYVDLQGRLKSVMAWVPKRN
ncbi:hypothetical protein Tco_0073677 [Tanacetum coccineum]